MASDGSSSGGSFFGGLVGGVIGFFVSGFNPAGFVKGFMYGSTIGGLLAPPTGPDQFGPRLDSLKITTSSNIATLPRAYGTVAHNGNIIWAKGDEYVEVTTVKKVKTGFFSKTKVTTYSYFFTGAIAFARSEASAILRVWHQGGNDLVYSATTDDYDTQLASAEFLKYVTFYYGTADQPKDPLISAAENEIHTSPYRGVIYLVYNMYPLEKYQNNIGMLDPKVEYTTKDVTPDDLEWIANVPADSLGSDQDTFAQLHNASNLDAEAMHLWRFGVQGVDGSLTDYKTYHYLATPAGERHLIQDFDAPFITGTPLTGYARAAHGKSDRKVFVSYVAGKLAASGEDTDAFPADPSLFIPGTWRFQPEGVHTVHDTFHDAFLTGGSGDGVLYNPYFDNGEAFAPDHQHIIINDDGIPIGVGWSVVPNGGNDLAITWSDAGEIPPIPYPVTSELFESPVRVILNVNVIDADNGKHWRFEIPLSAEDGLPHPEMHYAFYKEFSYFARSYPGSVKLQKNLLNATESYGSVSSTDMVLVKIGILNDLLYIVSLNASELMQIHILDLDLEEVDSLTAAEVLAEFGENDADFAANFSPDFDKLFYVRDGHIFLRQTFDGAETDLGEADDLIPGGEAPGLFNIHGKGRMLGVSTKGAPMPEIGIQFFTYGFIADPGKVPLADIIVAENALVGIEESDLDVTTIDQQVRGYVVSEIGPVRNVLSQLQAVFPFDVIQSGYQNAYIKRGLTSVATVTWQELGQGVSLTQDREMETQLPYKVELTYIDYDLDYQPNVQFAERRIEGNNNIVRLNIPIVFTASEAAQAAEILLAIYHIERRSFAFVLPPTYRNLEPSDIITLAMKDVTYVVRLTNIHYLANGQMECTAKQHRETVYVSTAQGASPVVTPPTTIPSTANPIAGIFDMPTITDANNVAGYSAVMSSPSDTWPGGTLYRTVDNEASWQSVSTFGVISIWGTCDTALGVHGGHVIDEGGSLTVRPYNGEFATVTDTQFLNEETLLVYGAPGRWEVCAARDAADNLDGTFTLSYWMRGRRGTEWATGLHEANDYFALISSSKFIGASIANLDTLIINRAVTFGRELDSASSINLTYEGENLNPLSPVDAFDARDDDGNVTGYFYRRSRLTGGLNWTDRLSRNVPLGEASEAYVIDILDGSDIVRTIPATEESFTYSAADQTTDFGSPQTSITRRIRQVSAIVGPGRALETTV